MGCAGMRDDRKAWRRRGGGVEAAWRRRGGGVEACGGGVEAASRRAESRYKLMRWVIRAVEE
eukprot:scaffold5010_cov97-Phaeocystis_antarctica.AAC.4